MRNHRFRRQTNGMGVFVGVTAESRRAASAPAQADRIGERVWLDTSDVTDVFRATKLTLSAAEIRWLQVGLRHVATSIAEVDTAVHHVIAVSGLEIVDVDYIEAALAPAIAGWAAEEFGFPVLRATIVRDEQSGEFAVDWTGQPMSGPPG